MISRFEIVCVKYIPVLVLIRNAFCDDRFFKNGSESKERVCVSVTTIIVLMQERQLLLR